MTPKLKQMIQDLINDRPEQAEAALHEYIVGKTQEVAGLQEAAGSGTTVVLSLEINYLDRNDNEKQGKITVFHTADTPEEAQALAKKLNNRETFGDNDDALYHYATNAFSSVSSIHGAGYIASSKVVDKAPKLGSKVFSFDPEDEIWGGAAPTSKKNKKFTKLVWVKAPSGKSPGDQVKVGDVPVLYHNMNEPLTKAAPNTEKFKIKRIDLDDGLVYFDDGKRGSFSNTALIGTKLV